MVIAKQKVGSFAFRNMEQQGRITAWHTGDSWGGGTSTCDSPCLERAWSASQRPQPGPLLAITPASVCSQWEPEKSEAAFQSGTRADAWWCCYMAYLHGMAAAWQGCSESLIFLCFPPHLIPLGGECYRTGLSFGNKGILIWTFNALFRCWCWKLLCVDPCMWASTWMHQTKQDCFCTCLQSNLVLKFLILSKRNTWEIGAVVMDKGQTFK